MLLFNLEGLFNSGGVIIYAFGYIRQRWAIFGSISWSWYCGAVSSGIFLLNGLLTMAFVAPRPHRPYVWRRFKNVVEKYSMRPYQVYLEHSKPAEMGPRMGDVV